MVDRLESLLTHFSVNARTFNAGALCGINDLAGRGERGQLHVIREGDVEVKHGAKTVVHVARPSLLFYPRPMAHRFVTDPVRGADFVCAHVYFVGGAANPIASALPAFTCLGLDELDGAEGLLALLFEEAFQQNCGRQAMLDHLFEAVLIKILRQLMVEGRTDSGMLAGLAHPQLRNALVAIHDEPATDWSLDTLAERSLMSRSVFARTFRELVGCTPGAYLRRWRVGLVQQSLQQGQPLKRILHEVGYGSEAALSRAFKAETGQSPREWRATSVP